MQFDARGFLIADLSGLSDEERLRANRVCPFSNNANESEIGAKIFSLYPESVYDDVIGWNLSLHSGYSVKDRSLGSSGGIGTWLMKRIMQDRLIDYAIHVAPTPNDQAFFGYVVSSTTEQLESGATSFYHPVQLRDVLEFVRNTPGRYAVTAIPCFAKALRLLMDDEPLFSERIVYVVGIVCGQLKSTWYLDYLCRHAGVDGKLIKACVRRKQSGRPADDYMFEAEYLNADQQAMVASVSNKIIGANWGMGFFKPKACDFCDDVFAETADIALMDAWLPRFVDDWRGTSLMVVRHPALATLLEQGKASGDIIGDNVTIADTIASQQGGLNHRRPGLRYRLHLVRESWVPTKRVSASSDFHWSFKLDQLTRLFMRDASFHALKVQRRIGRGIRAFRALMKVPILIFKVVSKIKVRHQARLRSGISPARNFHTDS